MKKATSILLLVAASLAFKKDDREVVDIKTVNRIKMEGMNNSKVMETLFELTDVNGPRLTGSTGMKNAELWAIAKLKSWGLTHVKSEAWGGFGKGWEIEKGYIAMTAPYYQQLIAVPKAWTPGTAGNIKADAIAVRIDSVADMSKYSGKIKGKAVILANISYDLKLGFTPDAKRYNSEDLEKIANDPHNEEGTASLQFFTKPSEPNKRAANILRKKIDSFLVAEGASFVVSGGRGNMGTVFTSNGASRAWDAPSVLPEMEMGSEHIQRILRLLTAGKQVTLEADIKTKFLMNDSTEYNVIGEIEGTDEYLKDEVVMLGAHMDSWHASTGATDNATGVIVAMEAVRILKALHVKPKRTIRIALWSGEEQGLLGSRGYVKKHFADRTTMQLLPEHKKVAAYYNLDNGAGKIRGIHLQGNQYVKSIFEAWFEPFKDLGAGTLTIKNTGSTDHIAFDEVGIPGFQFIQDPLEYGTRTHHTNMDSYDRVNNNDLMQASIIMASFVYNTAMRDELLPRKPLPAAQGK